MTVTAALAQVRAIAAELDRLGGGALRSELRDLLRSVERLERELAKA